jgi:hypothetical protein
MQTATQSTPYQTTTTPGSGLKVKTHVKAGGVTNNHNQTLVQTPTQTPTTTSGGLKVKTHVKAGAGSHNHNQTLVQAPRPR